MDASLAALFVIGACMAPDEVRRSLIELRKYVTPTDLVSA
jgi:hypothetical protein